MSTLLMKFKLLKRWNIDQFVKNGKKHIFSAFNYFLKMRDKHRSKLHLDKRPHLLHIVAWALFYVEDQQKNVTIFNVLSAVAQCDLYDRVIFLIVLGNHCLINEEYLISFRVLRCAYKLCGNYILPTFVNKEYGTKKKEIKNKLDVMKCVGCNRKGMALRSCKGCMKVFYCSKKCQKYHWQSGHKMECDMIWISRESSSLYDILKRAI